MNRSASARVNPYQKQNDQRTGGRGTQTKNRRGANFCGNTRNASFRSRFGDPDRAKLIDDSKKSVSLGTYHVEAGKIAEEMFRFETNDLEQKQARAKVTVESIVETLEKQAVV